MSLLIQRTFSGGEVDPALLARVDINKYQYGLRTSRNMFVKKQGGATNRPGTQFIGEIRDSTTTCRLIPFIFNSDQTYVLEFSTNAMRVIRNGAYVTETGKTISGITKANPGVVTATSHGFSNGDEVYISGVSGMTEINGRNFKVANVATHTFELKDLGGTNFNTSSFTTYSSGGTAARIYKLALTLAESELPKMRFAQSADVLYVTGVGKISRSGHASWSVTSSFITTYVTSLSGISVSAPSAGPPNKVRYEAIPWSTSYYPGNSSITAWDTRTPATGTPITVSVTPAGPSYPSGAFILKQEGAGKSGDGLFGYIGRVGFVSTGTQTLVDDGIVPDFDKDVAYFMGTTPSYIDTARAISFYQQRLFVGGADTYPSYVAGTATGAFGIFNKYNEVTDAQALEFAISGSTVSTVKHLVDLGNLVIFTEGGEYVCKGNSGGIITPTEVNLVKQSAYGCSDVRPLVIGNSAIFIQARGSIVRDLAYSFQNDSYGGGNLSIFSQHLFDSYTIVDWDFHQVPDSLLWAVRSDGTLLCCTYDKEHQILAWSRHDVTDGVVENVCVVPEGIYEYVYLVIRRTINGRSTRYLERFSQRRKTYQKDLTLMDSHLTYDGRNSSGSHTMTLSGGTNWTYDETITLTSSSSFFTSADLGNEIHLTGSDGTIIRFSIVSYSSGTIVTGKPHKTVPASMRSAAITDWAKAVDSVGGLWHLEGEMVSILGDGFVVASPNNAAYETVTVSNGTVALDKCYSVLHVGLPFISDLETLDIDVAQGESLQDKFKLSQGVTLYVEKTSGLWAGPKPPTDDTDDPLENLIEYKLRTDENYDEPTSLHTGIIEVNISPEWNSNGRVFVRQVDPLPVHILSVAPSGMYPIRG